MTDISNEKWIDLGTEFCNLREDYRKKFYYKVKQIKKTKAYKYYDMYNTDFIYLAGRLDNLIQKYYPRDIHTIKDINITKIFYNLGEKYDCDYFNMVLYNDIKTNIQLLEQYENFMSYMVDTLGDVFRHNIDYKLLIKYDKAFHKKLLKELKRDMSINFYFFNTIFEKNDIRII